ncbi:hypothetical protein Tsubulata_040628 [Turnera subulata]|uniref:TF-B3 domain-containing protein n=1 Tax=Turnera subulata TaxID=218843 RepID=A0A9Q0GL28_9ROSI|nr:hypothetical protein Tsubulata_040628 [Turnera subulata]
MLQAAEGAHEKLLNCEDLEMLVYGFVDPSEETKQAVKAATLLNPQNLFFIAILRPYTITKGCMRAPSGFTKKHLPEDSAYVKLRTTDGGEWLVRSLWQKPGRRMMLTKGWRKFAGENGLVGGDVCIFELINNNNPVHLVLKVTVFRAIQYGGGLSN